MEYLHSLRVHHSREGPINSTVNENAAVFQDLSGAANEHSLHQLYWLQDYISNPGKEKRVEVAKYINALVHIEDMQHEWDLLLSAYQLIIGTSETVRTMQYVEFHILCCLRYGCRK